MGNVIKYNRNYAYNDILHMKSLNFYVIIIYYIYQRKYQFEFHAYSTEVILCHIT